MLASVLRLFRDKESGEVFKPGDVFMGTQERVRHLTRLAYVQPIPEEPEVPEQPDVAKKPKRQTRARTQK